MNQKRYYSPFENDVIVKPHRVMEDSPPPPPKHAPPPRKFKCSSFPHKKNQPLNAPLGFLANLKLDDLIIIGLILLLVFEEQDERDMPLIVGLIALLLIEFIDSDGKFLT